MILATIVDTEDLLEVVWTAALAGIGVTTAYGLALHGIDRAVEFGRAGRRLESTLYGGLAVVSAAVVAAALVLGALVMVDK